MTYLRKILSVVILSALILTGCQSMNYKENVETGTEYPSDMFPVYKDATIYKYNFEDGTIDITFGTEDDYEKVSNYYALLFEHSKYDVTAEKMTTQSYISAGKTNLYKYLLEINKSVYRKEKKLYNTVVNLRININDFVIENPHGVTPTPKAVDKITPAPTNTLTPTDTPEPTATPYDNTNMDVISTVDIAEEQIFIECLDVVESEKNETQKTVSVLLKMINYGDEETGYVTISDLVLMDEQGVPYHSDMADGIFAGGVNILPGGYCMDYVRFVVDKNVIISTVSMPEGLGNRVTSGYELELAPLSPPMNAGMYDDAIMDVTDISDIPTFIMGQEYTVDDVLTIKLLNAQYFINYSSENQGNLMYTFDLELTNVSSSVIIPVELRDFMLFDIKHNIMIKPTVDLTPYAELAFNPVQNGLSENYHISFEVFEEIGEDYLCLLLISPNQQDNPIIYKIR